MANKRLMGSSTAPLIAIGALILVVILFLSRIQKNTPSLQETDQVTPTETPTIIIPQEWQTFTNALVTLKHPKEATAEDMSGEVVVRFMGKKQIDSGRTQTELFDGYFVRIEKIVNNANATLEEVSTSEVSSAQTNCINENGQVSPYTRVRINNVEAHQFTVVGCSLDHTETVISHNNNFYRITQAYVGDTEDQDRYKTITDQIVSTLTFY